MTTWSNRQRFEAIFSGEPADRPLVSAWRHFIEREQDAAGLAGAATEFQHTFQWDFVKINPRTTYYAEAWGNEYDYNRYDGVVPAVSKFLIHEPADMDGIEELNASAAPFQEQLDVVRRVSQGVDKETPVLQTVFSPLAVLEYLGGHRTLASNRPAIRDASPLPRLLAGNPEGAHQALRRIAYTLADYVQELMCGGADGVFYAVLGLARDGYLTEEEYKTFGRPYDDIVLEALQGAPSLLHTCGPQAHPERFVHDSVKAIHWADRAEGNPSLADFAQTLRGKAVVGGVAEGLFSGENAEQVRTQAEEAIKAMKDHAFILAPGCGLPLNATPSTLQALRKAALEA
ncbi:uroporphyrinogen decarboxylase family protein [Paenibacillus mendelii]|uniref:Uroporphyrinogen decarboxylase family protein n=1 Tax=Paenibacillus mendelii TaxID=206163 RepID=A0ABV6J852_9BACL|nr:uroporphyrinogen decarboxylase family protein [Paenibacillus mendelii]MCQ6561289.1 uroporphyrinogen-III decarboxylase [Paenibacillus mendelii]